MIEDETKRKAREDQEHAWIRAFQKGDRNGFDGLATRYKDPVFNLCHRMLGDFDEANDCAQETFVKAYRSLGGFRFESRFSTWIYTIAVNTCRNRMRSAGYRRGKNLVRLGGTDEIKDGGRPIQIEDPAPSVLDRIEQSETEALVRKAIVALPHDFRTVVLLRDVQGLSYEDIGRVTGYNPGTVKSKLARARQRLREILKGVI